MPADQPKTQPKTQPTTHDGWYHIDARLVLPPEPTIAWQIRSGDAFVLVLYSENRPRPKTHDKSVFNDELVIECPVEWLAPEASIDLAKCRARYQRGGQMLTYESLTLTGALQVQSYDGQTLAGAVELTAHAPRLDLTTAGELKASARFQVKKKKAV